MSSTIGRLLIGAACLISSASCGGDMLRTGRAPVFLVMDNFEAANGNDTNNFFSFLLSDVETLVDVTVGGVTTRQATYFNDNARATIRVELKNQTVLANPLHGVTMTRYHVTFLRTDGRNRPGIDVPYGFDGAMSVTINAGSNGQVGFELVRHQAKLEPPLRQLVGFGGLSFISAIAEVTFYGHDQNGNELSVTGRLDVQFGDFGDGS